MQIIFRNSCVLTNQDDLQDLFTFKNFPIFMGATDQNPHFDQFIDMKWSYSKTSGIIQLRELLSLSDLYSEQTTTGAIGQVWKNHHQSFAQFIAKYSPEKVLEIGGAHGILSVETEKIWPKIHWRIVEPNPAPIPECRAEFIPKFFDANTNLISKTDLIVHSHTMEHIYDPMGFLRNIALQLQVGQLMIFSIPNLEKWFLKGHANALNFEHTYLLTFEVAQEMLALNGFSVLQVELFREDHSIFIASRFIGKQTPAQSQSFSLTPEFPGIFLKNIERKQSFALNCNLKIPKNEAQVYLFGAHVFSQQLLNLGLNEKLLKGILDNDYTKIGRRLYGTNLNIFPPQKIVNEDSPIVIVDAGEYSKEIKDQLLNLHHNVVIWEPNRINL